MIKNNITMIVMRRLLPIVVLLPIALGILFFGLEKYAYISSQASIALFSITLAALLFFVISFAAVYIRRGEKFLQDTEKFSRLMIENRKDYAFFMLDSQGKIASWNDGAERLTGYKENEILGKSLSQLYTSEEREENKHLEFLRTAKRQKLSEFEGWREKKSGDRFWATICISAIFDEKNNLLGFAKLIRDNTKRKENDEKLKDLIFRLERSNQELERFAYIASHDLQEPLRMVSSFTQLLAKKYSDKLDAEASELIGFAVDGAVRMQQLITDLLAYSRITTKGAPFKISDSQKPLEIALSNLRATIEDSHAEITVEKLPTLPIDETQMMQLFQNLISNAIKFQKEGPPKIEISAKKEKNFWVFSVADNGIGIPPEFHEKIAKRYF